MRNYRMYATYKKPSWAPPASLFSPVWMVLYVLIILSFGFVGRLYLLGVIPFVILAPFIANLVFNLLFTPIQFGLRSFPLATLDIFLVLGTLVWALYVIYPYAPLVVFANIPYLLWVSFATVLQITIFRLNR